MKKILPFLLLALSLSCGSKQGDEKPYNQGINIIPAPRSLEERDGFFVLKNHASFYASVPELQKVADFFIEKMERSTGYQFTKAEQPGQAGIRLSIVEELPLPEEGYTLEVSPEGVDIQSKTAQGAFYGMQSLMQLFPAEIESLTRQDLEWKAPAVRIEDEPRFSYRGLHLDPCRHFLPVEAVKKHIDLISLFKLNRLHWHLTDDQGWRIEIKKYPLLTEKGAYRMEGEGYEYGGYYTQEEIREVVEYAAERFVTVIPEIELPGHALAAIAGYPGLSCAGKPQTPRIQWGVEEVVFCAGKEKVFAFLDDVMQEVSTLFPGEYIHIGGDECPKSEWEKCPLCQQRIREEGLAGDGEHSAEERLQSYFVQRVEKIAARHGKKIIGWNEILEGGLPPSATVMSWQGEKGGVTAPNLGHDVIMTPNSAGMYIDHYQGDYKIEPVAFGGYSTPEKLYRYDPVPAELLQSGKEKHILGLQGNSWSEYMYAPEINEYRIYPRILAIAEVGWSALENKDFADFSRRLNHALVLLDAHGVNYHIPQPEQPRGSCDFVAFTDTALLTFTTSRPIKVVYTTDGSEPSPDSKKYTAPFVFSENITLKIRSVLPSGKMSKTREIRVEKQTPAPALDKEGLAPGLRMAVIQGMYLDVDQMKASDSTWVESVIPSLREITRVNPSSESMRGVRQYAAVATGYVHIPENGVYYVSSDNEEVWLDGRLLVNNRGEVKRFSRHDTSVALEKGLHEFKTVFLGHIIGGWPSNWNDGSVKIRHADSVEFKTLEPESLFHE